MRALLVLLIVLLAAATTAYAYGGADVAGLSAVVQSTTDAMFTEPALLLLSGALLLGLGGAVRRFSL